MDTTPPFPRPTVEDGDEVLLQPTTAPGAADPTARADRSVRVELVAGPSVSFSTELFKSADYAALLEVWEKVAAAAKGPTIILDDEDRETPVKSLDELWRVALEQSRAGATFQRYKGLGEMNPEQLWETTMNPETRTLLKVTMEDADRSATKGVLGSP